MARSIALLVLVLSSATLHAQAPDNRRGPGVPLKIDGRAAVQRVDGDLWGAGADYKVRFEAGGLEFVPRLGLTAPRNLPLRFALQSVGRGTGSSLTPGVEPESDGLRVSYRRNGFIERYEVDADAVEQSFVFDALPPGDGDLIIRGSIDTELHVERDGEGYALRAPNGGGIRIGEVTGIDAAGHRAAGSIRIEAGRIELSLPEAFVRDAALPLVLDPRIAPLNPVLVNSASGDGRPSVAYDTSSGRYLVVFQRLMSASDGDIMGQFVSQSGTLIGSALLITVSTSLDDRQPSTANVNARDGFVVAYQRGSTSHNLVARGVLATGAIRGEISVAASADDETDVVVSGESSPSFIGANRVTVFPSNVQCFFINRTTRSVSGRIVTMLATGDLTAPVAPVTILPADSGFVIEIAAPKSSGTPRSLVPLGDPGAIRVVVARRSGTANDYRGRLDFQPVSSTLTRLGPVVTPSPSIVIDAHPRIDGNGRTWVCAWTQVLEENVFGLGVIGQSFTYDGASISPNTPRITIEDDSGDQELTPAVGWLGDGSCVIPFRDNRTDGGFEIWSASVDLFGCTACEPKSAEDLVTGPGNELWGIDVATSLSGGNPTTEEGLTVWARSTGPSFDVFGVLWRADDGTSRSVGPGCGSGGIAHGTCARVGNTNFTFRLRQSLPSASAFLVLSPSVRNLSCGSCSLVPDPFLGFVIAGGTTSSVGFADLLLPALTSPSLSGLQLLAQWIVLDSIAPPCGTLDAHFSNAIQVTVH